MTIPEQVQNDYKRWHSSSYLFAGSEREEHSDSGCRNQKYYDKIRPAGGRLFHQSLCGLYPWLQILLCLIYEAICRVHRTVGYIPGCETLASNQKSTKVQRAAHSHRFCDRWLSAPGGSVSEHPKSASSDGWMP